LQSGTLPWNPKPRTAIGAGVGDLQIPRVRLAHMAAGADKEEPS
jgi:hypothetical protein